MQKQMKEVELQLLQVCNREQPKVVDVEVGIRLNRYVDKLKGLRKWKRRLEAVIGDLKMLQEGDGRQVYEQYVGMVEREGKLRERLGKVGQELCFRWSIIRGKLRS